MDQMGFDALGEAPASVVRSLEGASLEKLATVYKRAECAGARAWMLQSIVIGVAQEAARYRDGACIALAKTLGCGKTLVFELGAIHREILQPRLERLGDTARFELAERQFYTVAVKAARDLGRPALELLEIAEHARQCDPKYTSRRFKRELLGRTAPRASEPKMAQLLRQLARVRQADLQKLTGTLDVDEWRPILDAAAGVIDKTRANLSRGARARAA